MSLLNISLSITRRYLYITVITLALTLILLPWSVLSYLRFYEILIPNASYELPVAYSTHGYRPNEIVSECSSLVDILSNYNVGRARVAKLNYNLELEIAVQCNKNLIGDTVAVRGDLIWGNDTQWGYCCGNDSYTSKSSFILQCDPRVIYSSSNWLVPYNLRHWVPPFLTNCERLNVINVKLGTFSDIEMLNLLTNTAANTDTDPARIRYHFDSEYRLQIDVNKSKLHVNVEWQGIRYYLFYHYYVCFALGVGLFWAISSGVCLVVSIPVWWGIRRKVKAD